MNGRARPKFASAGLSAMLAASLALGACGGKAPPPSPGTTQGVPPDLRGGKVMVLPVQESRGVAGDVDAELAFGLRDRGVGVDWILPTRLRRALELSPSLDVRLERMPVGMFTSGEVRRVGDPLFGELLRLSAVVDGEVALIPVRALASPVAQDSLPLDTTVANASAVSLWVALIHVRSGRVMWFGVVEGKPFPAGDPRALASAVDKLARTLLWYTGR